MKAIIIDDEKHVREGLLILAEWSKFGIDTIYEAADGEEAITLLTLHRPEIIFTDMSMPRRDGISLLKWISASNLNSKTIVISGYDDFEYMRNAIQYKSFDYILKPIDPEILNKTLENAIREWNEQADVRKSLVEEFIVVNEVRPLYWDRLFTSLLSKSELSESVIDKINQEYSISISDEQKTMAIISLNEMIIQKFQGDVDLAFFTVSNICNELLRNGNDGLAFRNLTKEREIVLLFWRQSSVHILIEQIQFSIKQFLKANCIIAIGNQVTTLSDAYETAQDVLERHNLLLKKKIVTKMDVCEKPILYLLDYSEELKWAVQSSSFEQIDTILQKIYKLYDDKIYCFTLEQLEIWTNQFKQLRNSWLKEYEISNTAHFYEGSNYWDVDGTFSFHHFREEKRKEFHDLLSTLSDVKYKKEKNNMQRIEEYLRGNYHEDINLQEIAERFFLSREYISRKFKLEFNETITDYLTKIRVEKARDLLENPHLKIYDISYRVGYQNEKYFSKVFKKVTGQTPNEYRASIITNQK